MPKVQKIFQEKVWIKKMKKISWESLSNIIGFQGP